MSGGFFRGTSADQDTRFSNKKAKLLKSQKFASELEHLVDISKVKMDVMRPWIANRATELLGFEDEVLINFIYGLLDGKAVNGKEVQISLTGFMEKNTGKFMKELWTLLLSAQMNASGVPQQILDAKEEETRTKMAEADRIANEIQKKREKESTEQERLKMDGGAEAKATGTAFDLTSKNGMSRISGFHPEDEKGTNGKNDTRGRNSQSPPRSMSKSYSNSRSYSDGRHKSRSVSKSPKARGRSISSERVNHSKRHSFTPRGRHSRGSPSPSGKRAPYSRRRSISRSRRRSPTPVRRRLHSPVRRRPYRSPSPMRRRSPSPMRRRYRFVRQKSPSPSWCRSPSPVRRRFPSPMRRRSPSPVRRKSPFTAGHRSPSPLQRRYRRSSSTPRRRSPSPIQRHGSPSPDRRRSPSFRNRSSPDQRSSSSPSRSRSPSPVKKRSSVESPRGRNRTHGKLSPVECRPSISLRSPQRDLKVQNDPRIKMKVLSNSSEKSPDVSDGSRSASDNKSPYESPVRQTRHRRSSPPCKHREEKQLYDNQEISVEEKDKHHSRDDGYNKSKSSEKRLVQSPSGGKQKGYTVRDHYVKEKTPERLSVSQAKDSRNHPNRMELKKKDQEMKSENSSLRKGHQELPEHDKSPAVGGDGQKFDEKSHFRPNDIKQSDDCRKSQSGPMSVEKRDHNDRGGAFDSDSEESGRRIVKNKEKRKHRRSKRDEDASDDYSDDSEIEDRKEAKRRKKEERKLRKEEKRRRREERHRRKEERRAEKQKSKNRSDDYSSDGDQDARRELRRSNDEETKKATDQKKLEIELREKALETLKAKKGMGH